MSAARVKILVVDPALASLLGALIGGAIASGSNLVIDRARAGREAKAAKAATDTETRRAARLLYDELDYAELVLTDVAHNRRVGWSWDPPSVPLPLSTWDEQRAALAAHADDAVWAAVASAYADLQSLEQMVIDEARFGWLVGAYDEYDAEEWELDGRRLTKESIQRVNEAISFVKAATDRLAPVVGASAVPAKRHRAPEAEAESEPTTDTEVEPQPKPEAKSEPKTDTEAEPEPASDPTRDDK